jgi:hypothetical protein
MSGNAGADRIVDRTNPAALNNAASHAAPRFALTLPVLLLLTAIALRAWSFTTDGLDWDESLYVVMAQQWLHGGLPYVAVWDQHPVGLPALFAAAQWLIGDGVVAARIAALLAVAATATLLARFLLRFAGSPWGGALAGFLYLLYLSRPDGLAANTELFNNMPVTAAAFVLLGEYLRPATAIRAPLIFLSSLLFGVGLQFKYVVFPEAAVLSCALLLRCLLGGGGLPRTMSLAAVAVAGGLVPTALATFYFWQAGALQAYLDANVRANLAYVGEPAGLGLVLLRIRYGLLPLAALLPWPFVLGWWFRDREMRSRHGAVGLWLLLWLLAALLNVALPMKFWKHYFIALIPPLCLCAGLAITLLAQQAGSARRALAVACIPFTVLPAAALIVKHTRDSRTIGRIDVPEAIAGHIRAAGSNGHDIYVFNYDPVIYSYTRAAPPTRFVLGIELAQYSGSSGAPAQTVIRRILATYPRWIVTADPSPYVYSAATWQNLDSTLRHYRLVATYRERTYVQPSITVRLFEFAPDVAAAPAALQEAPEQPAEQSPAGETDGNGNSQPSDGVEIARP